MLFRKEALAIVQAKSTDRDDCVIGATRSLRRRLENYWSLLGSWQRIALVVWTILAGLAVGRAALYHLPRHRGCYPIFEQAGQHWFAGQDLYESQDPECLTVFRYSPLIAAGLVPLGLLPDVLGNVCLRAAGLLALIPALWWWSRTALPRTISSEQRALFFLLSAGLANNSLMDVQFNILTLSCMLLAMTAVAEERWNLAALTASLACCLKAYPISLALVLAVVFPRRFAGRFVLMMAVCLGLPFLLQEPGYVWRQYQDWIHWGLNQRAGTNPERSFQDLMRLCRCWLVPIDQTTFVRLEVATGAGIALVCLYYRRRQVPRQQLLNCIFGLCCAWMMVLGPSTERTTYILLAPVVAAATLIAWTAPHEFWYRAALSVTCVLLTAAQLQLLFPLNRPLDRIAAQPFAALLFMAAVAVRGLGDLRRLRLSEKQVGTPR